MDLVRLLESKNRCLKRFLDLTEAFAAAKALDDLDSFQSRRDSILRTLGLYDQKIGELASAIERGNASDDLVKAVERALLEKDHLIRKIMAADDRVIHTIEQERDKVVRELANSQRSQSTLRKFKSNWAPGADSGSGLDEKL